MVREGRVLWWERPELWSLAHLGPRSGFIAEESCGLEPVSSGLGGWGRRSWKEGSLGEEWVVVDALGLGQVHGGV